MMTDLISLQKYGNSTALICSKMTVEIGFKSSRFAAWFSRPLRLWWTSAANKTADEKPSYC